jgi:hypothetical protein
MDGLKDQRNGIGPRVWRPLQGLLCPATLLRVFVLSIPLSASSATSLKIITRDRPSEEEGRRELAAGINAFNKVESKLHANSR